METLRRHLNKDEQGFTLIELMVVVLIIAILIAIAIPTFLGARKRAQDRAAQSNLRNALTAEKTFYTDNQQYTSDQSAMKDIEPSLTYIASSLAAPTNAGDVALSTGGTNNEVTCLTTKSASGSVFVIADVATGTNAGTYFGKAALTSCVNTLAVGQQGLAAKW